MASGITPGDELKAAFARAGKLGDRCGMLKIIIEGEGLIEASSAPCAATDEAAFELAQDAIEEESGQGGVVSGQPCYILLELPSLSAPSTWVLLLYIPPGSSVRDRMMYASTKDAVKKGLGNSRFASDLYGNSKDELTYASYMYKRDGESTGPITTVEAELNDMALEESKAASGGAQAGVSVAFSLRPKAKAALQGIGTGSLSWASLSVDPDKESIEFVESFPSLAEGEWPSKLSEDRPQFVFIKADELVCMVYYCPMNAPIKHKMLCSTVKASVQAQAAAAGVTLTHNAEITEPSELAMATLRGGNTVGPSAVASAPVVKVSKPGVKGGRRMPKRRSPVL